MYNTSLSYLPSSIANLVVTLEPVFTALFAYFLLGERLRAMQLLGSLIILTAVVFLRISAVHLMNHAEHEIYRRPVDAYQPTDIEKEHEPHPEMP